jgi:hypothetical protein
VNAAQNLDNFLPNHCIHLGVCTVTKAKHDAGAQHMGDGKFHVDRSEKSVSHIDWAAQLTWMTEFSIVHMMCSCVTLSFFNSVFEKIIKYTTMKGMCICYEKPIFYVFSI